MRTPAERKTVQARILAYAQEIGWSFVPRAEAERRRGFDPDAEGALVGRFQHLNADIYGNRDFIGYLRNQGKFFDVEESRELDLMLIDYVDLERGPSERRNVYEITEEFFVHNGRHGTREDLVFLINGLPVDLCMRRKWASCSTAGTFSFNDELILMDRELGDYVIVHEKLHFSVPNHGRLWKSLMRAHLGNYEELDQRLRENSELQTSGDTTRDCA